MTNKLDIMQLAYFKTSTALIDSIPNFFSWLKSQIGDFKVEGSDFTTGHTDVLIFSFYTNKVSFNEGESRFVDLQLVSCDTKIVVSSINKL
jgi:hypothetical protein